MHPQFFPQLRFPLQLQDWQGELLEPTPRDSAKEGLHRTSGLQRRPGQKEALPYQQQLQGFAGYGKGDEAQKM